MSKFFIFLSILLVSLIFLPDKTFAASACGSTSGVTVEKLVQNSSGSWVTAPAQIPEGNAVAIRFTSSRFTSSPMNTAHYRLRFDSPTTGSVQPVGNTLLIPITNPDSRSTINTKLQKGTHISTLTWDTDPNGHYSNEFCGNVTYTMGFIYQLSNCRLTINPPTPAYTQQILIEVESTPPGSYQIYVKDSTHSMAITTGSIDVGLTGEGSAVLNPLSEGAATVSLYNGAITEGRSRGNFCERTFNVGAAVVVPTVNCTRIGPVTPGGEVKIRAANLDPTKDYYWSTLDDATIETKVKPTTTITPYSADFVLGSGLSEGTHIAKIKKPYDSADPTANLDVCTENFPIGTGGIVTPKHPGSGPSTSAAGVPCTDKEGIQTAIGCIHTNPVELIKDVFKFISAIAGGLAFLMMLTGAYQMLTSAGNPESLQAGRERLTSAVIGLLFILFAVLLIQIIGIDILGLDKVAEFAK